MASPSRRGDQPVDQRPEQQRLAGGNQSLPDQQNAQSRGPPPRRSPHQAESAPAGGQLAKELFDLAGQHDRRNLRTGVATRRRESPTPIPRTRISTARTVV